MKALAIASVLLPVLAAAADLEVKGVRPGMAKAELVAAHPYLTCHPGECYFVRTPPQGGASLSTIAETRVNQWWFKFSPDERLTRSHAVLHASAGSLITSAFTEKFGKPTTSETSEFRTAGGLTAAKVTTRWVDSDTVLSITYPSGSINEMRVEIYSKQAFDAEIAATKAKAKKDL